MTRPASCRLLLTLLLAASACSEQIEVENARGELLEGSIKALLGPQDREQHTLTIEFKLRDEEGDDQKLHLEVCQATDAGDLTACGFPYQGEDSDGTGFLFTLPDGDPATHRFVWDYTCGRVLEEGRIEDTLPETSYIVRARISGTRNTVTSPAFTLADFEIQDVPPCLR